MSIFDALIAAIGIVVALGWWFVPFAYVSAGRRWPGFVLAALVVIAMIDERYCFTTRWPMLAWLSAAECRSSDTGIFCDGLCPDHVAVSMP